MFPWNFPIWQNAFIIQMSIVTLVFIIGKLLKFNTFMLLFLLSCFMIVPIIKTSNGINGLIFFYDIFGLIIIVQHLFNLKKIKKLNQSFKYLLLLLIIWPILSSILASVLVQSQVRIDEFIFQFYRYLVLFFYCFYSYKNGALLLKQKQLLFTIISITVFLFSITLLLGITNLINVDVWWELKNYTIYEEASLGKGSMFLYRAGLGEYSVICTIVSFYSMMTIDSKFIKFINHFNLLLIIGICLFSGSKQGFIFLILAYILLVFFYRKRITILNIVSFTSIYFFLFLFTSDFIFEFLTKINFIDYFNVRFIDYFNNEITNSIDFISERNQQLKSFDSKFDSTTSYLIGKGLGGDRLVTESDFLNSLSYFGIIGIWFYLQFIFNYIKGIYSIKKDHLSPLLILTFIFAVLFGIQQWFILTWEPINGTNNVICMLFVGLGIYIIELKQKKRDKK